MELPPPVSAVPSEPHPSLVTLTYVTYGLQALGMGLGAFAAVTVMGVFGFGWPSLIRIIITYVKRADARGTWLESHLRRQIRTFWIAVVAACGILLMGAALFVATVAGPCSTTEVRMASSFAVWAAAWVLLGSWVLYRVLRGWIALNARRAIG
jgi:uncharacterized membrane protein